MEKTNYTVYGLLDNREYIDGTKNPNYLHVCYIGQTGEAPRVRLLRHFSDKQDMFYKYNIMYGNNCFIVFSIRKNLNKQLALDLENKYIKLYKKDHQLFNTNWRHITNRKVPNTICKKFQVRCIETQEIFSSPLAACIHYDMPIGSFTKKCGHGENIGIDENENPLHWEYVDGHVNPRKVEVYKIYSIRYYKGKIDINDFQYKHIDEINNIDEWTPIYIGSTKRTLKQRFAQHYAKYHNQQLHDFMEQHKDEYNFCMFCECDNITSHKEALKIEEETTIKYRSKFSLFNINNGNAIVQATKEKISNSLRTSPYNINAAELHAYYEYENEQLIREYKKPVICIDTKEEFNSITEAAEKFQLSISAIHKTCIEGTKTKNGYSFAYKHGYAKQRSYKLCLIKLDGKPWYVTYIIFRVDKQPKVYDFISNSYINVIYKQDKHRLSIETISEYNGLDKVKKYKQTLVSSLSNYNLINKLSNNSISSKSKPCICIETGKIYKSIHDAAEDNDTSTNVIAQSCKINAATTNGLHFSYVLDSNKVDRRPTICAIYNNDKVVDIIVIKHRTDRTPAISYAHKYSEFAKNNDAYLKVLEVLYTDDKQIIENKVSEYEQKYNVAQSHKRERTRIYCAENNTTYDSVYAACKDLHLSKYQVKSACNSGKSINGYSLSYVDKDIRTVHKVCLVEYKGVPLTIVRLKQASNLNPSIAKVYCANKKIKEIYESKGRNLLTITELAAFENNEHNEVQHCINQYSIKYKLDNHYLIYVNEDLLIQDKVYTELANGETEKRIRCDNTNTIFYSPVFAAKVANVSVSTLMNIINGRSSVELYFSSGEQAKWSLI